MASVCNLAAGSGSIVPRLASSSFWPGKVRWHVMSLEATMRHATCLEAVFADVKLSSIEGSAGVSFHKCSSQRCRELKRGAQFDVCHCR